MTHHDLPLPALYAAIMIIAALAFWNTATGAGDHPDTGHTAELEQLSTLLAAR